MTNGTSTVNPSEVGWQFVPQYYTFVNKQPNRLHCFYTKTSTFIHGTEGEDGKPCFGQQEIHNKITSIGFQDCKVFIHSVDAQSSANGGIIIQPNGYFVLNDIFRFLKEEAVEESDDQGSEAEASAFQKPVPAADHAPAPPAPPSPTPPPPAEPEPAPTPTPAPPPPSRNLSRNPLHLHRSRLLSPSSPTATLQSQSQSPPLPLSNEPPATASPPPVSPSAPQQQPLATSPVPVAQPHLPAPAPSIPQTSTRKTWANLAASNPKGWGPAVARESRGTSEAPTVSSVSPAPLSGPQSPASHATTRPLPPREPHPVYTAAQNVGSAQCFVKSVTENVSDVALRTTLTTRFGPIKELEILRSKACAFLEFVHVDAARRAIAASLPAGQGGEGGIRIEVEGGAPAKILVETRKDRSERPPPRDGSVNGGDMRRGAFRGFRGRGGPGGGRGRGAPPAK
ncbi:putative G3BP-like protein [Grifola frondosa]|uniref:Putative G3BP-like protein n=1 Tax=Grifola frondosa TaxID=5627 RepID=A0A1C7LST9_GRIFR|nr:putative G3BP-like protein [Grifola frondosa]